MEAYSICLFVTDIFENVLLKLFLPNSLNSVWISGAAALHYTQSLVKCVVDSLMITKQYHICQPPAKKKVI